MSRASARGSACRCEGLSELCRWRVGDLETVPETAVYLQRRFELGLPVAEDAPLVVTEDGSPVGRMEIGDHLGRLRRIGFPAGPDR